MYLTRLEKAVLRLILSIAPIRWAGYSGRSQRRVGQHPALSRAHRFPTPYSDTLRKVAGAGKGVLAAPIATMSANPVIETLESISHDENWSTQRD